MAERFDRYRDSYGEAVQRSIAFSGQDVGFFTDVKADLLVSMAERHLGPPSTLSVLDVGCGVGLTDQAIAGRFGKLAGVDVSEAMIESARGNDPSVDYRTYDGRELPYEDGAFDMAFAICVVHHVEQPDRPGFAREVARVVRPGGIVAFIEHNPHNPLTRTAVARCEFDDGVVLATRRSALHLLEAAGLNLVEYPYVLFFPWRGRMFRTVERTLRWLPLGAQYVAVARVPGSAR